MKKQRKHYTPEEKVAITEVAFGGRSDYFRLADDPLTGRQIVHCECNRDVSLRAAPGYTFPRD
jgi:hypothetical protein